MNNEESKYLLVIQALDTLSEIQQDYLLRRFVARTSVSDIALVMRLTEPELSELESAALKSLRSYLELKAIRLSDKQMAEMLIATLNVTISMDYAKKVAGTAILKAHMQQRNE